MEYPKCILFGICYRHVFTGRWLATAASSGSSIPACSHYVALYKIYSCLVSALGILSEFHNLPFPLVKKKEVRFCELNFLSLCLVLQGQQCGNRWQWKILPDRIKFMFFSAFSMLLFDVRHIVLHIAIYLYALSSCRCCTPMNILFTRSIDRVVQMSCGT
jgi:hypothetical protein